MPQRFLSIREIRFTVALREAITIAARFASSSCKRLGSAESKQRAHSITGASGMMEWSLDIVVARRDGGDRPGGTKPYWAAREPIPTRQQTAAATPWISFR